MSTERFRKQTLVPILFGCLAVLGLAQSVYRDPQQRFMLRVPAGWTATGNDAGVSLAHGRAYASFVVVDASASPAEMVDGFAGQVGKQWKAVEELKRGERHLGGQPGAFAFYSGTNPAGARAFLKIAASAGASGGKAYVMFLSATETEFAALKNDFDTIEGGFLPGGPAPPARSAAVPPEKLAALEAAYKAGILTREEYEAKKRELAGGGNPLARPSAPPSGNPLARPASAPSANPLAHPASAAPPGGDEFQAQDGSFATRVPPGWKGRAVSGPQPMNVFEPEGGGEERIIVMSAPATVGSIQELAQQAAGMIVQMFSGLRPAGAPSFTQVAGSPAAEITYSGTLPTGRQARAWHGIILKERSAFGVFSLASPEKAQATEESARVLYQNMRPGRVPENTQLAAAIVGRWTFVNRNEGIKVGDSAYVSRVLTLDASGRFEYVSAVSASAGGGVGGGETRATGSYRVQGNTLIAQIDGGGQVSYTLELVQGGGLKINGELFIRE